MKKSILVFCFIFLFASIAFSQTEIRSTIDDQRSISLTVYNSNLGLVKDVRRLDVDKGEGNLLFMDVASQIQPQTVLIKTLSKKDKFTVLEQNYEYDLMNEKKLLDKYVGKQITLLTENKYKGTKEMTEATLLSNNNGQVYKINDAIYLGHSGNKILPKLPEDLIAKPTLNWLFSNEKKGEIDIQVTYLTNGITWKCDYVILLAGANDAVADLSGWVTLNNNSGTGYYDASLTLVAGEVNQPPLQNRRMEMKMAYADSLVGEGFTEEAFFEYHLYDLGRKTTVKNNQMKQVSLLDASGFSYETDLKVHFSDRSYYGQRNGKDEKPPVEVLMKFKNSKENELGMALPAGTMRVYKLDSKSRQQFIGADNIKHTPKDEEISIKLGNAFDVVAERKMTDFTQISSNVFESEWELKVRNHKKVPVAISVFDHIPGQWDVLRSTHRIAKEDAFTLRYDLEIPEDGQEKVVYKVRVRT